MFFITLCQTKSSQSIVRIRCEWLLEKEKIYRRYVKHGRSIADYQILRDITLKCKSAIKEAKSNYFSRLGESLNDPAITPKKYWSILHRFLHKRKIPKIPPIRHNNTFLTDTLVKANTFNSFFAKQCSLIETDWVTCRISANPPSLRINKSWSSKNSFCYSRFWC